MAVHAIRATEKLGERDRRRQCDGVNLLMLVHEGGRETGDGRPETGDRRPETGLGRVVRSLVPVPGPPSPVSSPPLKPPQPARAIVRPYV